jgi:hypothetical protein
MGGFRPLAVPPLVPCTDSLELMLYSIDLLELLLRSTDWLELIPYSIDALELIPYSIDALGGKLLSSRNEHATGFVNNDNSAAKADATGASDIGYVCFRKMK